MFQIPIVVHKEMDYDAEGKEVLKCGFKIGGGIDQNYKKSPQGYTDNVRFIEILRIYTENNLGFLIKSHEQISK